jgi:hypothetical protein
MAYLAVAFVMKLLSSPDLAAYEGLLFQAVNSATISN